MDLGFHGGFKFLEKSYKKLPFEIIWANDFNHHACETYRHNLGAHIHHGDIWSLLDSMPTEADVLIGGFPCQDISVNGKGAGVAGKRSGLYRAMVEAIGKVRPKIFVAENVKGLLMKHNSESLTQVLRDFRALGYEVTYRLYHVAEYGVPQSRERVIIVGTAPGIKAFVHPKPVLAESEFITAKTALRDLERKAENETINHIWSRANVSAEQGGRRLVANRPGYTIRAECHGNIQFHYSQDRRMSMREAARIQSFPDKFLFKAKLREMERQIGNAVPPVFAWHIAKAVLKTLQA